MLRAAAFIKERFNLPNEEAAQEEAASDEQDGAAQPSGKKDEFLKHFTASLCGPDEICTSAGR